jgi:ABC-type nitrate/sulfonate/bicarbonate transport system permease component
MSSRLLNYLAFWKSAPPEPGEGRGFPRVELRQARHERLGQGAFQQTAGKQTTQQTEAHPVPFRGGGFNPVARPTTAWLLFCAAIFAWQGFYMLGMLNPIALPAPSEVATALWQMGKSGVLAKHLGASLQRLLVGWLLGASAGLCFGFAVGLWSLARTAGLPFVSALFPIPKIALLPLFIVWFGIGEPSKIATIAFGVFFPSVISAYSGVDSVSRVLIRMGQSFNLPAPMIVWKIILPGALGSILAGCRISASIGITLLIAAEMIAAEYGIGALVLTAGNLMRIDQLLAGVVLLSLLGLAAGSLISFLERRLLAWR